MKSSHLKLAALFFQFLLSIIVGAFIEGQKLQYLENVITLGCIMALALFFWSMFAWGLAGSPSFISDTFTLIMIAIGVSAIIAAFLWNTPEQYIGKYWILAGYFLAVMAFTLPLSLPFASMLMMVGLVIFRDYIHIPFRPITVILWADHDQADNIVQGYSPWLFGLPILVLSDAYHLPDPIVSEWEKLRSRWTTTIPHNVDYVRFYNDWPYHRVWEFDIHRDLEN
jgi:hypothetical protein